MPAAADPPVQKKVVTEEVKEEDPPTEPECEQVVVEDFTVAEFVMNANDFQIDPGKFVKYVDGILRTDYKIGTIIRDEAGGRINHAVQ
jgi:calcium-dependent protein kinase